jgi:anti-anti-sigma factor
MHARGPRLSPESGSRALRYGRGRRQDGRCEPSMHQQVMGCAACGEITIYLDGDLDIATASTIEATMSHLDLPDQGTLVIDLTDVPFMDSRGVQVLLKARSVAVEAGCALVVRSPQRIVAKVLTVTGVDEILRVDGPTWPPASQN